MAAIPPQSFSELLRPASNVWGGPGDIAGHDLQVVRRRGGTDATPSGERLRTRLAGWGNGATAAEKDKRGCHTKTCDREERRGGLSERACRSRSQTRRGGGHMAGGRGAERSRRPGQCCVS